MFLKPAEVTPELAQAVRDSSSWTEIGNRMTREGKPHEPKDILTSWAFHVSRDWGLPLSPWKTAVVVLHALSSLSRGVRGDGSPRESTGALSVAELTEALRSASGLGWHPDGGMCLDCGKSHELSPVDGSVGTPGELCSHSPVDSLVYFGAVTWAEAGPDGMVWLTPLGRMLAASVFTGLAPSADADVVVVVAAVAEMPPRVKWRMVQPWLAARSPADAVRSLLGYAETMVGEHEMWTALVLADAIGPAGIAGWREWGHKPGFGVYARKWLNDHGEPVPPLPSDVVWLGIDGMLERLDEDPEEALLRFATVMGLDLRGGHEIVLDAMRDSGHPAAPMIVALLRKLRPER